MCSVGRLHISCYLMLIAVTLLVTVSSHKSSDAESVDVS